jgi:tetratricopeptide (TPR) repeat protein
LSHTGSHPEKQARDEFYNEALQLYNNGELEAAEAILDNLVILDAEDFEAWFHLALIREDKSDLRGAIEAYSAILAQDDTFSNIWGNLAAVYARLNERDKAEATLKIALETAINHNQPRSPIWNNYGAFCAEVGRYEEAEKMFSIVLQLEPENQMAAKNLSECKRMAREAYLESLDARRLASEATTRKDDPSWYREYGIALRMEGNREDAEVFLSKSIDMDPSNAWTYYELALVYYRERELEKASDCLYKAVSIDKSNALFWSTLGTTCSLLGEYDSAEKAHQIAVKLDYWDGRYWSQLGTALLKTNRLVEASKAAETAVKVSPNLDMAWNIRGVTYLEKGSYRKAIGAFERVVEINPQFADAWNNMALAQDALGNLQESIEACRKGIETGPHRREAWIDLIKLLYKADLPDEADKTIIQAKKSGIDISDQEKWDLFNESVVRRWFSSGDLRKVREARMKFIADISQLKQKDNTSDNQGNLQEEDCCERDKRV